MNDIVAVCSLLRNKEVRNEGYSCGSHRKRVVFFADPRIFLCDLRDGGVT